MGTATTGIDKLFNLLSNIGVQNEANLTKTSENLIDKISTLFNNNISTLNNADDNSSVASKLLNKTFISLTEETVSVNIYDTHNPANMILPAITLGVESDTPIDEDASIWQSDHVVNHSLVLSIRVHTAYSGGVIDNNKTILLIDTLIDILKKNYNQGTYRIMSFSGATYNEEFVESMSLGGQVDVEFHTLVNYSQT